jgi:hypothetical protein
MAMLSLLVASSSFAQIPYGYTVEQGIERDLRDAL